MEHGSDLVDDDQDIIVTTEVDELAPSPASDPINIDDLEPDQTQRISQATSQSHLSSTQSQFLTQLPPTSHQNGSLSVPTAKSLLRDSSSPPSQVVAVVVPPPKFEPLPYATSRSGVVYDVRMRWHQEPLPEDPEEAHPEQPRRISEIFQELIDADLVEDPANPRPNDFHLLRIQIRQATPAELREVHTQRHIDFVKGLREFSLEILFEQGRQFDSLYLHQQSWLSASLAAGGAIEATKAVVTGMVKNSIAVIRPPGHHAEHDSAEGFCFFNNVCVAAKIVQKEFPETCRKILILDWDVHHGNGVQRTFYDDPNVLYISLHVFKDGHFYPNSNYGSHQNCGEGPGLGRTVNVPWKTQGMGDADYIYAFQNVVMPIAVEFDPDLVMISAGFDAAEDDMLGGCHVSPAGFGHMTHMLMQLAKGKVVACLEGGYNLRSIAKSALAMTRVLMGEPPDRLTNMQVTASGVAIVQQVIRTQSKFWSCLYPKDQQLRRRQDLDSQRLHDVVREWQSKTLWDEYKMSTLFVLRQRISRSFKDQVLATPNYEENRPLLVIFHDPPEAHGYPNHLNNRLELHNTFITDVSKTYVDWAVKNDFAVIDVNIPKHLTDIEDDKDYADSQSFDLRAKMTQELAFYLWDNYIDLGNSSHIFLLGVGDAYSGLISLLSDHPTACEEVDLTINFISENALRPMRRPNEDTSTYRYYNHSMIFVSDDHSCFRADIKLKRKYGRLKRSPKTNLMEMMRAHKGEVTEELLRRTAEWRRSKREGTDSMDLDDEVEGPLTSRTSGVEIRVETENGAPLELDGAGDARLTPPLRTPPMGMFKTSSAKPSPARSPFR